MGYGANTLIIGSTSVIGSAIQLELQTIVRVKTAGRRNADYFFDLAEPRAQLSTNEQFDTAILVAADFGGPTEADLIRATQTNVVGSLTACQFAANAGAEHVILISSVFASYEIGDAYFNAYSLTKRLSEDVTKFYCQQKGIALTIVRPTQIYDSDERCRTKQRLLYTIVDCARDGRDFTISGTADPLE